MNVNPNIAWICSSVIILGVLAGVFVLVWHGSIAGTEALTFLGPIVGAAIGGITVHQTATAVTKANRAS